MTNALEAPTLDICLAIARFLDLADPSHPTHHIQTAYLSLRIADAIGLPREEAKELFIASLCHDFGLAAEERETPYELSGHPSPSRHRHSILAYLLLQELPFLKVLAPNLPRIILYHHLQMREMCDEGGSPLIRSIQKSTKEEIPLSSFILHLSGEISRAIDITHPILQQRKEIIESVKKL